MAVRPSTIHHGLSLSLPPSPPSSCSQPWRTRNKFQRVRESSGYIAVMYINPITDRIHSRIAEENRSKHEDERDAGHRNDKKRKVTCYCIQMFGTPSVSPLGQENVGIPVDQRDLSKPRHRCMSSYASLQSILRYLTSSCSSALEERREESEDDVQSVR